MVKRIFSLLLVFMLMLSLVPAAAALEGEGDRAADKLAAIGLVNGTGSGYASEKVATVEQAASLIVRLLGEGDAAKRETRWCGWQNVPSWAKRDVNYCAYQGILLPEEYSANADLTASQWCAMLLRAVGFAQDSFASENAADMARRVGLLSYGMTGSITRGMMFESAWFALNYTHRGDNIRLIDRLVNRGLCTRAAANALGFSGERLTAREIADRSFSAVVKLDLYADRTQLESNAPVSHATAFFITEDGLAVTNHHSIEGAVYGIAELVTGERYNIESVVYYDVDLDLAVIRIASDSLNGVASGAFNTIPMVGSFDLRIGDEVAAIGNPLGLGLAMSRGIICSTAHTSDLSTTPCILFDATISKGSSGGPLLNERGEAIAVTTGAFVNGNNLYLGVRLDPVLNADLSDEGITLQDLFMKVHSGSLHEWTA